MLTGPEETVRKIVFLFSTKFKIADESHVTLKSLNCFTDLFQEATYPGHFSVILTSHSDMMMKFWCDSDIAYLRGLQKKIVIVLYFSIINVFWLLNVFGVGGDASFAPQANLCSESYLLFDLWDINGSLGVYTSAYF